MKNYYKNTIRALCLFMVLSLCLGTQSFAQVNYTFNFDANSTGWTGSFSRFTGATACGGSGGAMRYNLYGTGTANLISPLTGTALGGITTISYDYKAANWSANTVGTNPWGSFDVQYASSASGPWTTFATVSQETQTGSCIAKSHTFAPPAGALFIRWSATWTSGDYYLNFDNVVITESALPPVPTQAPGTPTCLLGSDLTVSGTPSAGETWYWQTTANGTSTANDAVSPWTVYANGTYYVRSYNAIANVWSAANSITVTNFPLATDPTGLAAGQNPVCVPGTTLTVDPATGGQFNYWQGTNANGTDQSQDAATPYNVTASGTYYVRSFDPLSSCWSNSVSILMTVNTNIPSAPSVTTPVISCSGNPSIPLNAQAVGTVQYPYTFVMNDAYGDGWNGATVSVLVDGVPVLNAVTLTSGLTGSLPFNVLEGATITTVFVSPGSFPSEVSYQIRNENNVQVGVTGNQSTQISYVVPMNAYGLNWYDAVTAGNLLGTGSPFESVGTSVLNIASPAGIYSFYVEATSGGCTSTSRTLVEVQLNEVDVVLTPIDETCIGYANGSFAVNTVNCGTAPFEYSIDGGAYSSTIPTNLTAGTYSVVVKDAGGLESTAYQVVIVSTSTQIPDAPLVSDSIYLACSGVVNLPITATNNFTIGGLTTTTAGGNGCTNGNMFDIVTTGNTVITSLDVFPYSNGAQNVEVYYKVGSYVGSETNSGAWTLIGTYPITGTVGVPSSVDITDLPVTGGQTLALYVNYNAQYTTVTAGTSYTDGFMTINVGAGFCTAFGSPNAPRAFNGTVYYQQGVAGTIEWYDAATAGNNIGNGSPYETIGSSVIPAPTTGVYEFYAATNAGGCYSPTRTLVTVELSSVNLDVIPMDASCNNGSDGSFAIGVVDCGSAPFTYSIDGGAFGNIPTNLSPGVYAVQAMDVNNDLSGTMYITIGAAAGPDGMVINTYNNDEVEISWNENGSATSWTIEWGAPGFTPGTGNEIGTATAADTFYLITGLDESTEYDIYVTTNCGAAYDEWDMVNITTDCDPIASFPWCEDFEATSSSLMCWKINNNNADGNFWGVGTLSPNSGTQSAQLYTGSPVPDDYLIMPRLTLTNNEVMTFNYKTYYSGDFNEMQVLLSTTGTNAIDFTDTLLNLNNITNNPYADTSIDLSAYSGNVYIAFHASTSSTFSYIMVDDVCVDICIPTAGQDGTYNACRLDSVVDLNSIITSPYDYGTYEFAANPGLVNDTLFNISMLAAGTYTVNYLVKTACTTDTTVATITVFDPSSAGQDGQITACRNQPISLISGLNGNVDMGGTWYNPSLVALPNGNISTSNIPGQFNYYYVSGNGVCPDDTALVLVDVLSTCNYLAVEEMYFSEMSVYPNPSTGVFNITNEGSSEVFNYEVTDINGRVILNKDAAINGTSTTVIDLKGKERGTYFISVFNVNAKKVFRVVLQ